MYNLVGKRISRFFMGRIARTYESSGTGKSSMASFAGLCYDGSTGKTDA